MWLFTKLSTGPAKVSVRARVTLVNAASFHHESSLKSYSAIIQFFLKRYVTNDNISKLDAEVCDLR